MLNPDGTKTCPACAIPLPTTSFYRVSRKCGDGFSGYCMTCTKRHAVEWQNANPEKKKASDKRQHGKPKTPEQRAKLAANQRVYVEKNRDKINARSRSQKARWKELNPEQARIDNQLHNNSYRARKLGLEDTFRLAHWRLTLEAFAHRCAFCGVDGALLEMEHVVPMSERGPNAPGNVVPACRPCNAQKSGRTLAKFCELRHIPSDAVERIKKTALQTLLADIDDLSVSG